MQCIMILGYWNHPDGQLPPPTLARLDTGFSVYQQMPTATVVVSGGFGDNFNTSPRPHAEYKAAYLQSRGVSAEQLILLSTTKHTVDEAMTLQQRLQEKGCQKLTVVTSEFHVPRAALIFQHFFDPQLLQMVAAPNDGLTSEQVAHYQSKEQAKIELIQQQGGLWVNGELIKLRL